jgi:hypothetical protein
MSSTQSWLIHVQDTRSNVIQQKILLILHLAHQEVPWQDLVHITPWQIRQNWRLDCEKKPVACSKKNHNSLQQQF